MGTGSRGRLESKTQGQTSLSPAIFANLLLILADYRMKMNTPPETVPLDRTNGALRPLKWCMVTAVMVH